VPSLIRPPILSGMSTQCEDLHTRTKTMQEIIHRSIIILLALTIITCLGLMIRDVAVSRNSPEAVAVEEATVVAVADEYVGNCKKFNTGDYVRIQYGDFAGVEGRIIGGCGEREEYQVEFVDGSETEVPHDGISGAVDVSGWRIGVDSSNNLVVVEEKKNE